MQKIILTSALLNLVIQISSGFLNYRSLLSAQCFSFLLAINTAFFYLSHCKISWTKAFVASFREGSSRD